MTIVPMDRLVAHRGYQRHYPENTRLALRKAIEHGAFFVETDVLFSVDGQAVLYHDTLMKRLSGLEGAIHLEPVRTLLNTAAYEPDRLGDRFISETIAPLSALTELLHEHPQVTAFVELKRAGLVHMGTQAALDTVYDILAPVLEQVILISFDYQAMRLARKQGFPRIGMVLLEWEDVTTPAVTEGAADWLFCDITKVPAEIDLADLPVPVAVYEVTDSASALYWLKRGASLIETFDIVGVSSGDTL